MFLESSDGRHWSDSGRGLSSETMSVARVWGPLSLVLAPMRESGLGGSQPHQTRRLVLGRRKASTMCIYYKLTQQGGRSERLQRFRALRGGGSVRQGRKGQDSLLLWSTKRVL